MLHGRLLVLQILCLIGSSCRTDFRNPSVLDQETTIAISQQNSFYEATFKCADGDLLQVQSTLPLRASTEDQRTDSLIMSFRSGKSQWDRIVLGLRNFNLGESEEFYQRADFYSVDVAQGKDCSLDVFVAMGVPETDWSYAFTLQYMKAGERVHVFELTGEGETIARQDITIDFKP